MPNASSLRLQRPFTVAMIVFLLAAGCAAGLIWHLETLRLQALRADTTIKADGAVQTLKRGVMDDLPALPDLSSSPGLAPLAAQGLAYEVWWTRPDSGRAQIIAAYPGSGLNNPVERALLLGDAPLTLSVAPLQGWNDPGGLSLKAVLALGFSALLAYFANLFIALRLQRQWLQDRLDLSAAEARTSRLQLQSMVSAIPDLLWELGLDGRFYDSHGRHPVFQPEPRSLIGKMVEKNFSAEAAAVILSALREAHENGVSVGKQYELKRGQARAWFELNVSRKCVNDMPPGAPLFVVLAQDITQRKAAELKVQRLTQLYSALSECNKAIVRYTSENELFHQICRVAVQLGGMKMAWIGMLDEPSGRVVPVASYGDEGNTLAGIEISVRADTPLGHGSTGTAMRDGKPFWCQDIQADPRHAPWQARAARSGWRGGAALPLMRNKVPVGVFCLYVAEVDAFDDVVRELLTEMAIDVSFALDNFEREAIRKHAELGLRASEARYRAVAQSASDAIIISDRNGNIAGWNRGAESIFGYTEGEAEGMQLAALMPERYRDQYRLEMRRAVSGVFPGRDTNTLEMVGLRKDASEFPLELSLGSWEIEEGRFFTGFIRDITVRKQSEARLQLAAKVFEQSSEGITITDADRKIVLINQAFTDITGYNESDAIGQNPRLLSSGRQTAEFYRAMWESIDAQGQWQGEIWNKRKDGHLYAELLSVRRVLDTDGKVTNYIGTFSDVTRYKAAEEHILRLGHFDPLTGLANRILLNDRINHAICMAQRSHAQLAVLFFDLDHFKYVNDSLGHSIGDKLLIEVAQRLKSSVREQDTIARLGGDEFVLVLPDTDAKGAAHVAGKVLRAIAQTYWIDQYELVVTPSIGAVVYPDDGIDFDTLFKRADAAMYCAKKSGRNMVCFFTAEMQERSARTLQLEIALRSALKRDQFTVHYQPQISLDGGRVIGAEALLRWTHPELGTISPVEFIPIAEENGEIMRIGEWVMRSAAAQLKTWMDAGLQPMTVAVNLSAVQFRFAGLPDLVMRILEEVKLPPQYLELELTESVAMDNPLGAIAVMNSLHERGVRMSIDDFGTGYSSLSYLKRFQVHRLKIDRSFVRDISEDPEDKAIVGAIISMAKSLGLQTIAEGVETEGQLAFLREQGCTEIQGYYFSKPLPAEQFEAFVRNCDMMPAALN